MFRKLTSILLKLFIERQESRYDLHNGYVLPFGLEIIAGDIIEGIGPSKICLKFLATNWHK